MENVFTYHVTLITKKFFFLVPFLFFSIGLFFLLTHTSAIFEQVSPEEVSVAESNSLLSSSIYFEKNVGQMANEEVWYKTTDAQATHFFLKDHIKSVVKSVGSDSIQYAYALKFHDINEKVINLNYQRRDIKYGIKNYIIGKQTIRDIPVFTDLTYLNLWEGIDASFYAQEGSMKYDYIVQPYADPFQIEFSIEGAKDIRVNDEGELEFTSPLGTLKKGVPYTYQKNGDKEKVIPCRYLIEGEKITFELGEYDKTIPLIIDPVALKWASFLGGNADDIPQSIHVTDNYIYLTGATSSSDFPTTLGSGPQGNNDVFVTCMEKDGSAIVWSTLIGGSENESGKGIAVDSQGDIYVTGETFSSDFPINGTVTAYDDSHNGSEDIFVLRLSPDGTELKYSTFIGTNDNEDTYCKYPVIVDGVVYTAGYSNQNFSTTPGVFYSYTTYNSGVLFGIDTEVGGSNGLVFSTFLSDQEAYAAITDIELSKDSSLLAVGVSREQLTIAANAIQKTGEFDNYGSEAPFLAKFTTSGEYLYSTWVNPIYSGSSYNYIFGAKIELDSLGDIYVSSAGIVNDIPSNIILSPAVQAFYELSPLNSMEQIGSNWVNFMSITKIPADFNQGFEFVSVLPNDTEFNPDEGEFKVDEKGKIHVYNIAGNRETGFQFFFPYTNGSISRTNEAGLADGTNYYVIDPSGSTVLYGTTVQESTGYSSSYHAMAVDRDCRVYLMGQAQERNGIPVTPSYRDVSTNSQVAVAQANYTGGRDVFLAVFEDAFPNNTINDFSAGNNTFCLNSLIYQNPNEGPINGVVSYESGDGSSATHNLPDIDWGDRVDSHPELAGANYQWQLSKDNGISWTNIDGAVLPVLKPEPESTAGTIQYRRGVINGCCDTLFSNVATATIAGTLNLDINVPSEATYYCEGSSTPINISITGASGNISWQWYNGFSALSNAEINPASGSGDQSSFTASIPTTLTEEGSFRLVVTDAGGCKKESSVVLLKKSASAGKAPTMSICPGDVTNTARVGPPAVNPLFDYSWTGPAGFTSTEPNPEVSVAGVYTLHVKLITDASFCAAGATSVTIDALTTHDAVLTSLTDVSFCQGDAPTGIGLSATVPSGYVFQWSPGTNLDNAQAFNPVYDPGILPFGEQALTEITYTFSALRLSDGCTFETDVTVSTMALALADAGSDQGTCDGSGISVLGSNNTSGLYWQWEATSTTYSSGLAALTSDPAFTIDSINTNQGADKFAIVSAPVQSTCYEIEFELRASYVAFPNSCYTSDKAIFTVCPASVCEACPAAEADFAGTNGSCGGTNALIEASVVEGLELEWTTHSVDGVLQAAGTAPRGLFTNDNGTQGIAINPTGPHPEEVIANFDDVSWGWTGANVVVYQVRAYGAIDGNSSDCSSLVQVFSGQNAANNVELIDKKINVLSASGTEISGCGSLPYTLTGGDHAQAPNNGFIWNWVEEGGGVGSIISNGDTPFPTLSPTSSTNYIVTAQDPLTGCIDTDTMQLIINTMIVDAGSDRSSLCEGSLYQLGNSDMDNSNYTYSWSPSAGLNYPIGTANSTVARPYLVLPSAPSGITYTVTVTDPVSGCQAYDEVVLTTNTDPPTGMTARSYTICAGEDVSIYSENQQIDHTYQWSVFSGGGSLSWFSDQTNPRPSVSIPAGTAVGTYVFQITKTKGFCGSVTQNYTIDVVDSPTVSLASPLPSCTTPYTAINVSTAVYWRPIEGLYTDANGTTPIWSTFTGATVYVIGSDIDRTYDLRPSMGGCNTSVFVPASNAEEVDAGPANVSYCSSGSSLTLGVANSGTVHSWTPVGYSSSMTGVPATPSAGEITTMNSYLSSTSINTPTFSQTTATPGIYVYKLTSTFSSGCVGEDEVRITVPDFSYDFTGSAQQTCSGNAISIGSNAPPSGYTYVWSALSPNTENYTIQNSTAANPTVTPVATTTYSVVVTNGSSGCTTEQMVTVSVSPKPAIADVDMPVQCAPVSAIDLTAQVPGYAVYANPVWYQSSVPGLVVGTPASVSPIQTTEYFLVAENDLGCSDTAMVRVNIDATQTPVIIPIVSLDCSTDSVDLTLYEPGLSDPANSFEWHSDNTTNTSTLISNTTVGLGSYYLFEISPNGCVSTSDNMIVQKSSACVEICDDGIDNDGDGLIDNNDPDCNGGISTIYTDCGNGTADLSTITASNQPSGTLLTWHSATPVSSANRINDVSALSPGTYYATFYDTGADCYSSIVNTVIVTTSICISNTCPDTTVDLTTAFSSTNTPVNSTLEWHTVETPVDNSTLVSDATQVGAGTYYAVFYNATDDCYGADATAVTVEINDCEICNDGIDNDGDLLIDCDDPDCITSPTINLSANGVCPNTSIIISATDIGASSTYSWNFGLDASPATATGMGPHIISYSSCGIKTVSLTVLKNGCSLTVDSILTIIDNDTPVWDVIPQDLIMECEPSAAYADSIALWLANIGNGVVSDNCNVFSISNNYTGLNPDCGNAESATVEFTAIDSCGNSATASAMIQIIDSQGPILTTVNDITVDCNTVPTPPTVTAIDSCDTSPTIVYQEVIIQHPNSNWKSSAGCSLLYEITNGTYDDKSTPTTSDDEVRFSLTVIGTNTGSGWSATIGSTTVGAAYYTTVDIGPIATGGATLNFSIIDDTDNSCSQLVSIDPSGF